ncbi:hypothetical protein SeMB42_g06618 [Synchytrium endobioticum]|uniref:Uncharacterized protein n=1 Tax=Synchytrium endobioticum TaxID=286115 RepID=A0A507CC70_9FUNG|nr:hypothetical protein SeMB42_g06618 [Synchytrium endobioticum]TPX39395.1 hypothetical protein SeLEV6574_g07247 [Synchytrium endobioticum]
MENQRPSSLHDRSSAQGTNSSSSLPPGRRPDDHPLPSLLMDMSSDPATQRPSPYNSIPSGTSILDASIPFTSITADAPAFAFCSYRNSLSTTTTNPSPRSAVFLPSSQLFSTQSPSTAAMSVNPNVPFAVTNSQRGNVIVQRDTSPNRTPTYAKSAPPLHRQSSTMSVSSSMSFDDHNTVYAGSGNFSAPIIPSNPTFSAFAMTNCQPLSMQDHASRPPSAASSTQSPSPSTVGHTSFLSTANPIASQNINSGAPQFRSPSPSVVQPPFASFPLASNSIGVTQNAPPPIQRYLSPVTPNANPYSNVNSLAFTQPFVATLYPLSYSMQPGVNTTPTFSAITSSVMSQPPTVPSNPSSAQYADAVSSNTWARFTPLVPTSLFPPSDSDPMIIMEEPGTKLDDPHVKSNTSSMSMGDFVGAPPAVTDGFEINEDRPRSSLERLFVIQKGDSEFDVFMSANPEPAEPDVTIAAVSSKAVITTFEPQLHYSTEVTSSRHNNIIASAITKGQTPRALSENVFPKQPDIEHRAEEVDSTLQPSSVRNELPVVASKIVIGEQPKAFDRSFEPDTKPSEYPIAQATMPSTIKPKNYVQSAVTGDASSFFANTPDTPSLFAYAPHRDFSIKADQFHDETANEVAQLDSGVVAADGSSRLAVADSVTRDMELESDGLLLTDHTMTMIDRTASMTRLLSEPHRLMEGAVSVDLSAEGARLEISENGSNQYSHDGRMFEQASTGEHKRNVQAALVQLDNRHPVEEIAHPESDAVTYNILDRIPSPPVDNLSAVDHAPLSQTPIPPNINITIRDPPPRIPSPVKTALSLSDDRHGQLPTRRWIDPNVFNDIPFSDQVGELLNKVFTIPETLPTRRLLTIDDVPDDLEAYSKLLVSGSFRAAAMLAHKHILSTSPANVHQLGLLWLIRLSSLAKLKLYDILEKEVESLRLDSLEFRYERYPDVFPDAEGCMIPFQLRVFAARIPALRGRHAECIDALYKLCRECRREARSLVSAGNSSRTLTDTEKSYMQIWKSRHVQLRLLQVSHLMVLNDVPEASKILEAVASDHPDDVDVLSAMGRTYLTLGSVALAREAFARAEKLCGASVVSTSSNARPPATSYGSKPTLVLMSRALLAMSEGDFSGAASHLTDLITMDPTHPSAVNNLAVCLLYLGNVSQAVSFLESMAIERPTVAGACEALCFNLVTLYDLADSSASRKLRLLGTVVAIGSGESFDVDQLKLV